MNYKSIMFHLNQKPHFDFKLNIIYQILLVYNCRISEILTAKWSNFVENKFLILEAKKKSNNIIVRDRIILKQIKQLPVAHNLFIFAFVNYKNVYNYLIQNNLVNQNKVLLNKNQKITHYFRYQNVDVNYSDETNKVILHHKSKKSQTFYLNKKHNQ